MSFASINLAAERTYEKTAQKVAPPRSLLFYSRFTIHDLRLFRAAPGTTTAAGIAVSISDWVTRRGLQARLISAINDDMSTQELISKEVESLPEPLQREVYDFARFLHLKSKGELQLLDEIESWEAASDEDMLKLERSMADIAHEGS